TLACALLIAWLIGRALKVDSKLVSLVGVGTGICGGSAIAAIAPIIEADDDEIAFAISTVFLFNIIAVVIFPLVGHLLHLTQDGFGIWAGTAINDTSSVVAAAFSYGPQAGQVATITKLARTTMIIPIAFGFAYALGRKRGDANYDLRRVIPWFVFGFLLMAVLNTSGVLGTTAPLFGKAGKFLITVALAGVGLGANLRKIVKTGPRPILLGMLVWIGVAVVSLLVQAAIGQM
ncbi:MAG: putative sulfate exporter family transporter, partial [Armatimonadota bacterium]